MGLTKQYLRYVPAGTFNITASANCNIIFIKYNNENGRYVAVGASENIIVWDLRLSEKALVIPGDKHEVTQLASNSVLLAAGLSDGTLKLHNLTTTDTTNTFSGHSSAITCLAFDSQGHRLASGAKDTEIVVWDLIAERGLVRLTGHRSIVTQVQFLTQREILISSSKDSFVKLWDIATGHCFKTIAGYVSEVWGLVLMRGEEFIVSASFDEQLKVWQISDAKKEELRDVNKLSEIDGNKDLSPVTCTKVGSILRSKYGKKAMLTTDADHSILAVYSNDYVIDLFQFLSEEKAAMKHKKRMRKERKQGKLSQEGEESEEDGVSIQDIVRKLPPIKCRAKVKSANIVLGRDVELRVAVSLANNTVELYHLDLSATNKQAEVSKLRSISSHGHRSEVRAVAFSSDSLAIISGSGDQLKIWNRPSLTSLRTVDTGYILSILCVPGDRHVLAGTKDGRLLIIDIAIGDILEEIPAHTSELWSICQLPDQTGVVTGGGDNSVKLWQLELVPDTVSNTKAKVLSLLHTRTLQLEDCVLCVRVSPDSRLLAVALLDSTVKIFLLDTLKFFLSLYGHKMPVLSMDISSDSTIIATGSADRNIKIWGLDFGDCHKSIFAHEDSVTGLAFVPRTHYFFSTGKDGRIKQWDADNFQKIITLEAHHGEAWGLAISPDGKYVVSCGQDRVLRLYERSEEPLVLEDEQETELAAEEENTLATAQDIIGASNLKLPSHKTVTAEQAAELLLECLQVGGEYRLVETECKRDGVKPPQPPAIMAAFNATTADEYLLEVILRIKASDLEETLLLIPYTSVCELLPQLKPLLSRPLHADRICSLLTFIVKVHFRPLSASPALQPLIAELTELALTRTHELRDLMGENYHGLLFYQREIEDNEGLKLFTDATVERKEKEKRKRKREGALKRVLLTV